MITLALLVSLLVGALSIRTYGVYTFARQRPQVAALFAPNHPLVVTGLANFEMRRRVGLATPATKQAVRQALRKAPLLEEPMLLAGIDNLIKKDDERAAEFLAHALIRNPRSRLARLFMLEIDLRRNQVPRAVSDMTILTRLLPDVATAFVPELARMARDPRTSRALTSTLRSDPQLLALVLHHLVEKGAPASLILQVAGNKAGPPPRDYPDWREALLRSMVGKGDFEAAHRLWAAFAGLKQTLPDGVYDGSFKGLPGLPPFNWSLASSEMGAAERAKGGVLQVEYYGRTPGDLATQVITLAPGRYRFAFYAEGDLHDAQHRMVWRVQCLRKDPTTLLELPVANIDFAGRRVAANFTVPDHCPGQLLRLAGEPTEFPKNESVTIGDVRIQRIGAPS